MPFGNAREKICDLSTIAPIRRRSPVACTGVRHEDVGGAHCFFLYCVSRLLVCCDVRCMRRAGRSAWCG